MCLAFAGLLDFGRMQGVKLIFSSGVDPEFDGTAPTDRPVGHAQGPCSLACNGPPALPGEMHLGDCSSSVASSRICGDSLS